MKQRTKKFNTGFLLLGMLVFSTIAIVTIGAFVSWSLTSSKLAKRIESKETALQIAEAGIEYSRWYLAHYQNGFTLGNTGASPYVYNFEDKDGNIIGTYTLTVTPPPSGSTLVKIKSTGATSIDPTATRSISIQLAIPSLAKYAVFANSDIRFGQGTTVYGPLHSNGGIRFDGIAWNKVSSAKSSYDDPDHNGAVEFGVHTHVTASTGSVDDSFRPFEAPPNPTLQRSDIFKAGREFPVPAVDFTGITNDLSNIKTQAIASGRFFNASGGLGYLLTLKTDDTFDIYKVTSLVAAGNGCTNDNDEAGWGTWSVKNKTKIGTYAFPTNGLIFLDDDVWVEGQINTARLTIAAAHLPDTINNRKSITVNNNLTYTNYDGQDVLALIAQNNINAGLKSADTMRIDGALIAQNGRVGRFYYNHQHCDPDDSKNSILLYGMIGTNQRYGFAFTDGTGYDVRTITYDPNLLYAPPPNFPLASDKYQIISWEELEN